VKGARKEHVCAFARGQGERTILVIVPRFFATLLGFEHDPRTWNASAWEDTRVELPRDLSGKSFGNIFTGRVIEANRENSGWLLSGVLKHFPVALLASV